MKIKKKKICARAHTHTQTGPYLSTSTYFFGETVPGENKKRKE